MRVKFTDGAEADFENALIWSARIGLKSRLAEVVERAIDLITDDPARWREVEPGVRRFVLQKLPYSIIYAVEPDQVVIVAISHHKREPGHWRERG